MSPTPRKTAAKRRAPKPTSAETSNIEIIEESSFDDLDEWKPTGKRFVAFLDILGFKDMVLKQTHAETLKVLKKISDLKVHVENMSYLKGTARFADCKVHIVSFSDSIIIFSKSDRLQDFEHFLYAIRMMYANSIRFTIPIKGGIAHGEITIDKTEQIYFGQPLIDAYTMEEDVNYFGVVAHSSIDLYLSKIKNDLLESSIVNQILFKHSSPLKCGNITHYNLDWFGLTVRGILSFEDSQKLESIIENIETFYKTASGSPRRYVDNTLSIFKKAFADKKLNFETLRL